MLGIVDFRGFYSVSQMEYILKCNSGITGLPYTMGWPADPHSEAACCIEVHNLAYGLNPDAV